MEIWANRLQVLGIWWFAILLPFQFTWLPTSLGLMIFGLGWILKHQWREPLQRAKGNSAFIGVALLFSWYALSVSWSDYPGLGWKDFGMKIPILAWALGLSSMQSSTRIAPKHIAMGFAISTVASSTATLALWIWRWYTGETETLGYHDLVIFEFIPIHYFGMYISFAIGLLLNHLFKSLSKGVTLQVALVIISLAILGLTSALLAVRIQWIVLFLALGFTLWNRRALIPKYGWGVALALFVLFSGLLFSSSETRRRALETAEEIQILMGEKLEGKETNHRFYLWKHGLAVIKEHWLLGTGMGSEKIALNEKLQRETARFWDGQRSYTLAEKNYSFHSVYLQHWGFSGLIGISLFLYLLISPFLKKGSSFEIRLFLLVVGVSFLTESMLRRQAGIFFFSFFYALLWVYQPQKSHRANPEKR
jgi:O-antigen ligase